MTNNEARGRIGITAHDNMPRGVMAQVKLVAGGAVTAGVMSTRRVNRNSTITTITAERATHAPEIVSITIATPQVTASLAMTAADAEAFSTILAVATDQAYDDHR